LLYPIGSICNNGRSAVNPATLVGCGTCCPFAAGRVMVGFNSANALFDTAEETGGSADAITVSHTHTATVTDPGHVHQQNGNGGLCPGGGSQVPLGNIASGYNTVSATTGISVTNASAGSSGTNANYQPYITVYMWKRTA